MTAINTNVSALNAQYYLANTNKEMEQSMQRLSSGFKVNSAADDAAGLAIAGRMDAQTRGLTMAIKNANDAVSLAQTAEGALGEVTNMLQRIRELAVNSANSTLNDSDRLSLDNEVQALKAEIDRVGSTTTFNSQNLLDGSYSGKFQIGDKDGQTVNLKIASAMTDALGMGGGSSGSNSLVSARISTLNANGSEDVQAGDITINGQALGEHTQAMDMEDLLKNINDNVDNVTATAFNVVVAATIGDGVTGGDGADDSNGANGVETGMVITVTELGQTTATAFTISASSSMDELVANINNETGGVVAASVNDNGKLVLSNNTGAAITVEDDSSSGSGFTSTATTYNGFVKLEADDNNPIRIEKGNKGLASAGTITDLSRIGFRELKSTTANDGYTMVGSAVTAPATALAKGDLNINGVEMYDADIATDSIEGKLNLINSKSAETGVTASANFSQTFAIDLDNLVENDVVTLNGTDITVGATGVRTIAQFVTNINAQNDKTGLTAVADGNNITLSGENVQALTIAYKTASQIGDNFNAATTPSALQATATTADRDVVISDADVVEGRTFTMTADTGGSATAFSVSYTVTADDVSSATAGAKGTAVAKGLADALRNDATVGATFVGGAAATTVTAVTASTTGVVRIDDTQGYGLSNMTLVASSIANALGSAGTTYAAIKLDSVNNSPIKIDLGQNTNVASHGLLEANVGAADFDVNDPTLSAAGGTSMSGLTITSATSASAALKTLDNAIDSVNAIRGNLGAIQNRLSYTTNNLSSIVTNTEGAKGRIMDADFAMETSKLAKTQILSQAATSMLAQANQSKQSLLALLQ